MKKSRVTKARILSILRQQGQGQTVAQTCHEHTISEPAFCQCKSK